MSSYGYGGGNPYDQRGGVADAGYGAPSAQYGGYSSGPAMGRDEYTGNNVEMEPLTGTGTSFPRRADPNAILNECRDIDRGIKEIKDMFPAVQELQSAVLTSVSTTNGREANQLNEATTAVTAMFRNLTGRVKNLKQKPESGLPRNAPQVGQVDRSLRESRDQYLNIETAYTRKLREQSARQYRIVRPNATEEEVEQAIEDQNVQVFSQALMQSDRRGQAQSTLNAVQERNAAIKKIESQMIELAELFQDMDNLVVQQEAAVVHIEGKGEEVVDHMDKGTQQIAVAIQSAKNTRKWKWWCLGITVLIIIIIVVVILIYKFVIQGGTTKRKRFVLTDSVPAVKLTSAHAVVPGAEFTPSEKSVLPGLEWKGEKLVIPGVGYTGSRKFRRFRS